MHAQYGMSPTAIAVVIMLALVIDWMSIGAESIRDRIAFLLALPALRAGFDGSTLDQWTVAQLTTWIDAGKAIPGGAPAQAATSGIISAIAAIIGIYCIGVLIPSVASSRLGPYAQMTFGGRGSIGSATGHGARLNWRLWSCALALGLLADVPGGLIGDAIRIIIDLDGSMVAPIPAVLFGGSAS